MTTDELEEKPKIFSKIIDKVEFWQQIEAWLSKSNELWECHLPIDVKFNLLFRASEHEFLASSFHEHCDNKGPTIVIIKSDDGYIFGGVNFAQWESDTSWSNMMSFLFVLVDGFDPEVTVNFSYYSNDRRLYAAYNYASHGPMFGHGSSVFDLFIVDKANISMSLSNMPQSFKRYFLVTEYEVFGIQVTH